MEPVASQTVQLDILTIILDFSVQLATVDVLNVLVPLYTVLNAQLAFIYLIQVASASVQPNITVIQQATVAFPVKDIAILALQMSTVPLAILTFYGMVHVLIIPYVLLITMLIYLLFNV